MSLQPWVDLLDYARWAPSPHNTQPWKIKPLSSSEAQLYYDPGRLLTIEDTEYRFFFVAIGIFCECLQIAARARGLDVAVSYVTEHITDDTDEPQVLASLKLVPATGREPLDPELIKARRTSRLPYDGRPLSELALTELAMEAERFGHAFKYRLDREFIEWVLELDQATLFYDLQDPATRQEIISWFRFTSREAEANRDGLWSRCFGFPGWLLRFFLNRTYLLRLPIIRQATMAYYSRSMTGVATVGWLAGPFTDTRGLGDRRAPAGQVLAHSDQTRRLLASVRVRNHERALSQKNGRKTGRVGRRRPISLAAAQARIQPGAAAKQAASGGGIADALRAAPGTVLTDFRSAVRCAEA